MVPPIKFIPLAEETGLIVSIGDWVLQEACRQNKAWQNAGLPPMTVSVNVSARQFRERDLVGRVASALEESGLEAKYLELELTESLIMQDVDLAIAVKSLPSATPLSRPRTTPRGVTNGVVKAARERDDNAPPLSPRREGVADRRGDSGGARKMFSPSRARGATRR